jgi:ABC-type dipeptide/oligopeptide/nickel transport system permease component
MVNYILRSAGLCRDHDRPGLLCQLLIIKLPPGDFLTQKLEQLRARGDRSAESPHRRARVRYGLDRPFMVQYTTWVGEFY